MAEKIIIKKFQMKRFRSTGLMKQFLTAVNAAWANICKKKTRVYEAILTIKREQQLLWTCEFKEKANWTLRKNERGPLYLRLRLLVLKHGR